MCEDCGLKHQQGGEKQISVGNEWSPRARQTAWGAGGEGMLNQLWMQLRLSPRAAGDGNEWNSKPGKLVRDTAERK